MDFRLRTEGGANLRRAGLACGVRRYIQQSSGFFLAPGDGLADESVGMATDASEGVAAHARTYAELEMRLLAPGPLKGIALLYGFFYGPGTWYSPEGACADRARRQEIPITGKGAGVWSWVHIVDAAHATVAALTAPPGVCNVVDDDPSPVNVWLPAFATSVGAPPPPQITEEQARAAAGEEAIYYGTKLRGGRALFAGASGVPTCLGDQAPASCGRRPPAPGATIKPNIAPATPTSRPIAELPIWR